MRKNRYLPRILLVGAMAVGGVLFYQSYTGEVKQELVEQNPVPSFVEPPDPKPLVPESRFYVWDDLPSPKPFSPTLQRVEARSYVRKFISYDSPGCIYYVESCECDGYVATLLSIPPQYVCYGIETCTDIDKFVPEGCDDN